MKKLGFLFIGVVGLVLSSMGQVGSSASANTTALFVTPISIVNTGGNSVLDFGTVAASNTAGTIENLTTGSLTATGGASIIGGTSSFASFTVTGSNTESFGITLPGTITLAGNSTGVTVGSFQTSVGLSTNLVAGSKVFTVGGILTVPADVLAGTYSNATGLTVTVNYN